MSETLNLIALHGAIDQQLKTHPELVADVARLLPGYGEPATLGWYDTFRDWILEQAPETDFPDLERAIANIATEAAEGRTPKPRSAARRLLAVAALARAFPDGSGLPSLAPVLDFTGPGRESEDLVGLVAGSAFSSLDQWGSMIQAASAAGLVSEAVTAQHRAPPGCLHSVVRTPLNGVLVDAAQLETSFWTDAVDLKCASKFLDPLQWPTCSEYWCEVRLVGSVITQKKKNPVYREEVSLDCTHRATTWGVRAYLECHQTSTATEARLDFDLAPSFMSAGDEIMVDEGWLRVREENSGIRVETVKRVKFRNPALSPHALATVMCLVGYADLAGELMFNCAIDCKPATTKKGKHP